MVEGERLEIEASRRHILGKKVKRLRREGVIPANVYGRGLPSLAIQLPKKEVERLLRRAGAHEMVYLVLDGEEPRPCFVRDVQIDPVTDGVLHVDFYQVALTEKVRVELPLHLIGEAPAVKELGATLLQLTNLVMVEGLPTAIPPFIEVDVSSLRQPEDVIHVEDLSVPPGIVLLTDPHQVVAKVVLEEVEAEVEAEGEASPEVEVIRRPKEEEEEEE